MQKSHRQQALIDLIANSRIAKQEDLAKELEKSGFRVTQASISRDLDELGVVKTGGFYTLPRRNNSVGVVPIEIKYAGDSLIVVKTPAGLASAAAVRIDSSGLKGIVGTIAGDDTIFVAVAGSTAQKTVAKQILELF